MQKIKVVPSPSSSGRPHAVTLWTDSGSDPSFSRAINENRALTLIQLRATKHKDYCIIGFHKDPHASYLMFPRSLPEDGDLRVIGIKYDLVDERPVGKAVLPKTVKRQKTKLPCIEKAKPSPVEKPKPPVDKPKPTPEPNLPPPQAAPPAQPVQKKFTIQVRGTATLESSIIVQAPTKEDAEKQALGALRKERFVSNDSDFLPPLAAIGGTKAISLIFAEFASRRNLVP